MDLSSKAKSAPRLVVVKNNEHTINNCFIVGDGLFMEAGKDVTEAIQLLLMTYYVFDLSYPKMYQLLGLLQVRLFGDNATFFKSSNYIKFDRNLDEQHVQEEN